MLVRIHETTLCQKFEVRWIRCQTRNTAGHRGSGDFRRSFLLFTVRKTRIDLAAILNRINKRLRSSLSPSDYVVRDLRDHRHRRSRVRVIRIFATRHYTHVLLDNHTVRTTAIVYGRLDSHWTGQLTSLSVEWPTFTYIVILMWLNVLNASRL